MPLIDPMDRAAVPILLARLGIWRTLRVGMGLRRRLARGAPFDVLPAPTEEAERLSREQIAPAVVLYQLLAESLGSDEALQVTEEVVVASTVVWLREQIGPLERSALAAMDGPAREAFVRQTGARFFNATMRWDRVDAEEVSFTVTACRFPRLCAEAGVPELAPVFCKGDAVFFGTVEPNVSLTRPETIAGGASACPFTLRWTDSVES